MNTALRTVRLSKHAKFRVERSGYVLLCNCKYLQDFRLPLEHLEFLRRLSREAVCEGDWLAEGERALIDDLRAVLLLDDALTSEEEARLRSASLWDNVAYAEEL